MMAELLVNGAPRRVESDARQSLLSVLRDELELAECKYGCGEGQCCPLDCKEPRTEQR